MKQLSFKEAKRLTLKKWMIVKEHGDYVSAIKCYICADPELKDIVANCGFCERWTDKETETTACTKCELFQETGHSCYEGDSIFQQIHCLERNDLIDKFIEHINNTQESI